MITKERLRELRHRWRRTKTGKESRKRWTDANPEKVKQYRANWREKNEERIRAYYRAWYKAKTQALLKKQRKRRELIRATGTVTNEQWQALCQQHNNRCASCGKEEKLTRDHIHPISKGGKNSIENIQPLCISCNSRKRANLIK